MRTHCPSGHEYTPENTGIDNRGGRFCRECGRNRARRYKAEHPDVVKAHREKYGPATRERAKPVGRARSRARGKTALMQFNDGAEAERAAVVAWLGDEQRRYPRTEYSDFAAMIAEEIGAKEHLK
jgi:hypothetical protein